MGGLVVDIWIEWLIRMAVKLVRRASSRRWHTVTAVVQSAAESDSFSVGLTLIRVSYTYSTAGEVLEGAHHEPFLVGDLAKDYVHRFPAGSETPIRMNPADPRRTFLVRS